MPTITSSLQRFELWMLSAPNLMPTYRPDKPLFLALPAATCWAPAWCIRSAGPWTRWTCRARATTSWSRTWRGWWPSRGPRTGALQLFIITLNLWKPPSQTHECGHSSDAPRLEKSFYYRVSNQWNITFKSECVHVCFSHNKPRKAQYWCHAQQSLIRL